MSEGRSKVVLRQRQDFCFDNEFSPGVAGFCSDEPPPLGGGQGPTPVQLLCASVGNCLSDSLLFALRKYKQSPDPLSCMVEAEVGRNAEGRLRVLAMHARLQLGVPAARLEHLERVLAQFETFCTVTQSVGNAFPIRIEVVDADGLLLKS